MISNERHWPSRRPPERQPQPYYQPSAQAQPPRPYVPEDMLKTAELQVERKHLLLMLKENARGRFLRIAEETNGRRNSIVIPSTGLRDFQKLLEELVRADAETPTKDQPPQAPLP